jgi:hypothetical protein
MRSLGRWWQRHKHAKNGGCLRLTKGKYSASTAWQNKPVNQRKWEIMYFETFSAINSTAMLIETW